MSTLATLVALGLISVGLLGLGWGRGRLPHTALGLLSTFYLATTIAVLAVAPPRQADERFAYLVLTASFLVLAAEELRLAERSRCDGRSAEASRQAGLGAAALLTALNMGVCWQKDGGPVLDAAFGYLPLVAVVLRSRTVRPSG